jgi:hypothetical protein
MSGCNRCVVDSINTKSSELVLRSVLSFRLLMTLFLIDLKNFFIRDIVLDVIYNNIIDIRVEVMDMSKNMKKL